MLFVVIALVCWSARPTPPARLGAAHARHPATRLHGGRLGSTACAACVDRLRRAGLYPVGTAAAAPRWRHFDALLSSLATPPAAVTAVGRGRPGGPRFAARARRATAALAGRRHPATRCRERFAIGLLTPALAVDAALAADRMGAAHGAGIVLVVACAIRFRAMPVRASRPGSRIPPASNRRLLGETPAAPAPRAPAAAAAACAARCWCSSTQ